MGHVHADFVLTNLFSGKTASFRAMIDTGAQDVYITPAVADALGFDVEETSRIGVTVADGRRIEAPVFRRALLTYQDRFHGVDVVVLGDQCLVGVLALESLCLIVDPVTQELILRPGFPPGCQDRL